MGNEVKIRVRTDESGVSMEKAQAELAALRAQVNKDVGAMTAASNRLAAAREKAGEAARKAEVDERRLGATLAENRPVLAGLNDAQKERTKALNDAAKAAEAVNKAEEAMGKRQDEEDKKKKPEGLSFDVSKSFLDKGQLMNEAKSYGMQAGAVYAGALASGISTVGAAGLFIGIAAAAQSSNQQVKDAYSKMWGDISLGAQQASSVLAGDFIKTAESLGRTFNALKPELTEGFMAAKPVIADLTDGVDRMARTAMPGLVTAAKAASDASGGLADMLDSTGRGVANFFTESAAGAKAGGDAFRSFGVIVERLGSFAGRIIADLANNSTNLFPRMEQTVDAAAGAIENLAHVALPGLASGAGLALSGMTMLLNLASALIGALGPLAPMIGTFASSLKLIDMVSFGQVGKSWDALKTSVGQAEGFTGKAKAGFGSLLTGLGPLAAAAGVVSLVMADLSHKEQVAAAAAAQHSKNVDALSDALRKSQGVINGNVRESAAQALANTKVGDTGKSVLDYADKAHVSLSQLTDAYLGNRGAQDQIIAGLDAQIERGKSLQTVNGVSNVPVMSAEGHAAEELKATMLGLNGTYGEAVKHNLQLLGAAGAAATSISKLAVEFGVLGDKASTAEQKTAALVKIMDTIAGRNADIEQVTEAWEKFIDGFNKKDMNFSDKNAGSKKYVQSLIDASGQIKLTTEDGRKLYDTVTSAEQSFESTAVAMKAAGSSSEDIRAKLQSMRDAFVKNAEAMGFTKDQAEALATKYGLLPREASTYVSSNLQPEIQRALELGGTIRALPDGSFEVTANTAQAQGTINKLIQTNDGKVIHIHVATSGAQLNVSNGSFARLQASGGPVAHAAEGGARTGPILVNEQGQEGARLPSGDLITLPMGSDVVPHSNMQSMTGRGGGGRVDIVFGSDGSDLGDLLLGVVRRCVRVEGGGNVQLALGRT